MRILLLLALFLPANLAFVLLSDLNFLPSRPSASAIHPSHPPGKQKDRLRIQLLRWSANRTVLAEAKHCTPERDLGLPLTALERVPDPPEPLSCGVHMTQPSSLRVWLAATPHQALAPPV